MDKILEDIISCSHCGLRWEPARVDESYIDANGRKRYRPGPYVRCVKCKNDSYKPIDVATGGEGG